MSTFRFATLFLLGIYLIASTIFSALYWVHPRKKEVIVYLPAPTTHPPDSITVEPTRPSVPERPPIHLVSLPVDASEKDTTKSLPTVAENPDSIYTAHDKEIHPTFLGLLETYSIAKAPCRVTEMGTSIRWVDEEEVVKSNFEKQITEKVKKENKDRYWSGFKTGATVTAVTFAGIVVYTAIKTKMK